MQSLLKTSGKPERNTVGLWTLEHQAADLYCTRAAGLRARSVMGTRPAQLQRKAAGQGHTGQSKAQGGYAKQQQSKTQTTAS